MRCVKLALLLLLGLGFLSLSPRVAWPQTVKSPAFWSPVTMWTLTRGD